VEPWSFVAMVVREVIEGVAPRVQRVRSSITEFLVDPRYETCTRMLASLRSLEVGHLEELAEVLRGRVDDLHSTILEAASGSLVDIDDASEYLDELLSIGVPPSAATEILYAIEPDTCPLIDAVAIEGCRRLGIELDVPRSGEDYVSIVEDKLDRVLSVVERFRDSMLSSLPLYGVLDAVLTLAARGEVSAEDLRGVDAACRRLRAFAVLAGLPTY